MKKKFTLLISCITIGLFCCITAWGQSTTWWGAYDCAYPNLSLNNSGSGTTYTPNDAAGTSAFKETGFLIDGQASHSWNLGNRGSHCNDPAPADPGAGHSHAPLVVQMTGTGNPYIPLHYNYFHYSKPRWYHSWSYSWTSSGGFGCSGGSNTRSSSGNVASATIAIQAGAIRLHHTSAIEKLAGSTLTSATLTLPTSYTLKFDAKYIGPQGVTISGNGALSAIGNGQAVGFYAGTTQPITFNGGSILYLGPTSTDQSAITVTTATGAVNIKNYMAWTATDAHGLPDTHGVALGAFTTSNITVGVGNLNIYNWNKCESISFANAINPTINGAGSINIYTESLDGRMPAVDTRVGHGYKSVIDGGTISFTGDAQFSFAAQTGNLQIVGQSVTFNNKYTYASSASSPLHEISANSLNSARNAIGCGVGDVFFKGAVTVTKKDGDSRWFATNDIKTDITAPVAYVISGTSKTDWHADRDINLNSSVDFALSGTGDVIWYADRDILTNQTCAVKNKSGAIWFDVTGTSNVLWNAIRHINTKGRADFNFAPGATGALKLVSDTGNIVTERAVTVTVNEAGNDILLSAEGNPYGNIYMFDSVDIKRGHLIGQGLTEILAQRDIRTAMVTFESKSTGGDNTDIISHLGDIYLGHNDTTSNPTGWNGTAWVCVNPIANQISYDLNRFVYTIPDATAGKLNIKAGYKDIDLNLIPNGGGNIYFTHINETLGSTNSNYNTEVSIPFSNRYVCDNGTYNTLADYEQAGIIGGVGRCAIVNRIFTTNNTFCTDTGLIYHGFNGELLFDAGTRGNIIINNGSHLSFQDGTGNAKFLTRWGDIDMRYPFDVDSMRGGLLFYANSELPNKLKVGECGCSEKRNNVYLQDFQYNPVANSGSVFIGADNNIKLQYGGLKGNLWNSTTIQRDPFYSGNAGYPCGGDYHCDSDTSKNKARDLILNFAVDTTNQPITSGGFAAVASDLIDVYRNMIYTGGQGSGMSAVPGYGALHGEAVAGYGLFIKTQANKDNWNKSDFDVNSNQNREIGAACDDDQCNGFSYLHQVARVTFHSDARIYTENQRSLITSPVLETYGFLDLNTHNNKGGKTSIAIHTDSLIMHDSLIIDGKHTQFTSWSPLRRSMPIFKFGHQRMTPPAKEDGGYCAECYVHTKDKGKIVDRTALDTIFVTFRNDASVPRLHTLVADHAVLSFLTDSFDNVKGNPTLNAKFYTDTFKIRNHVELFHTKDHTHDGHFELISEEQMQSKNYAGVYSRHLHLEPVAPTCANFGYSQLWLQDPALDVITTSTFGGFGWIHADVHVEIEANLFPGYASLRHDGNCYEQKAGILRMQDLRIDKGANLSFSIGDNVSPFVETYGCSPETRYELGGSADCLDVDSLTIFGEIDLDILVRPEGLDLGVGESRCFPIIRYQFVGKENLNNLRLKKDKLTSKDHKTIDGIYYLALDFDTVCNVVSICVSTMPNMTFNRLVRIPSVAGVTTNPIAGDHHIGSGKDFTFKATYANGNPLAVKTNRTINGVTEEIVGVKNANGEYEYVIQRVQQDIYLAIGPEYAAAASIDGVAVWSHDNVLYIRVDREDIASIYSVAGQLVKLVELPEGDTSFAMQRGMYVVTLKDGSVHKVIIK